MQTNDNLKFMLCGDSISRGVIYDEIKKKYVILEENFVSILQQSINGIVFNSARFGNTILKAIGRLPQDLEKNNPDVVLIEFGGNDCDFNWENIADNPEGIHLPNTDYNIFQDKLKETISGLNSRGVIPVLLTIPPIDADRYFNWVSKNNITSAERILRWLGSVSKIYWWQERYNSAILSIAQVTKTRWIDIRSAFLSYPDFTKFLCADGIHPNRLGHELIADKIMEYIKTNYKYLIKNELI